MLDNLKTDKKIKTMKDFFETIWESLTVPMDNDFMSYTMMALLWVIVLAIIGGVGCVIFYLLDSCFLPVRDGVGTVAGTVFEESHYSTIYIYNASTKTSMPHMVWHPNAWKIIIEFNGLQDDFYLPAADYVKFKIGHPVHIEYSTGRLLSSLYVKSVSF